MKNSMLSSADIAAEAEAILAQRTLARRRLSYFASQVYPPFAAPRHIAALCAKLEEVAAGRIKRLLITMPPRHGKPVFNGTMVLTAEGVRKEIAELVPGDRVITHLGRSRQVLALIPQGELPCVLIRTVSGREVTAALDHPFLTPEGWVNAGDLVPGMTLANVSEPATCAGEPDRPLEEFRLAGYFIGDGSTGWSQGGRSCAASITAADVAQCEDIEHCAEALGFTAQWRIYRRKDGTLLTARRYNLSGGVREWLKATGLAGGTSHTKRVPTWVFRASPEQVGNFVAAYFGCDGSINQRGGARRDLVAELYSVSRDLLADVQHLLLRLGIQSRIATKQATIRGQPHTSYRLTITSQDDMARFRERIPLLGSRLAKLHEWTVYRKRFSGGLLGDEIVSIADVGLQDCSCITVDEDHSYTVNDLVCHNSTLTSHLFPPWYLGNNPDHRIIACSYSVELAYDFSRKARSVVISPEYRALFPHVGLAADARAMGQWNLADPTRRDTQGRPTPYEGGYVSAGVGGGITGRGAHIILVDDPLRNRQDASSKTTLDAQWDWYTSTVYTRLEGPGAIVLVMCMAGDTPVLMQDGTEKSLRDIRPGDRIATYEDGKVGVSTVRNWANQGPDTVFEIRMKSGITVRANARHPFLVQTDRGPEWQRTAALVPGTAILRVIGASGEASSAPRKDATNPPNVRGGACPITACTAGQKASAPHLTILSRAVKRVSNIATKSTRKSMIAVLPSRMANAPSANSPLSLAPTHAPTGAANSASTIAMRADRSEHSSVTTAISSSDTEKQSDDYLPPLNTYGVIQDTVLEVVEAGVEDVFDLEVERTANFIANGLVSHNTRWSEEDLAGRLIREMGTPSKDQWDVFNLPALAEEGDLLGRGVGEALWPEKFDEDALESIRVNIGTQDFTALYQQRPFRAAGTIFRREWWQRYRGVDLSRAQQIIQVWDTAFKAKESSDYNVCSTWALLPAGAYILDVFRERLEYPELKRKAEDLHARWRPNAVLIEDRASGQSLIQDLERNTRIPVIPVKADTDKPVRASAVSSYVEARRVYLPDDAAWVDEWVEEHAAFPYGAHDDQVDTSSMALKRLFIDTHDPGQPAVAPPRLIASYEPR
jgi:predicted phage terminase large subunit-like protein